MSIRATQKANLAGFLAIIIFSVGSLVYALSDAIPSFQFLAMVFLVGGLSLMGFQKLRGEDLRSQWKQPLSSYALLLGGIGVYNVLLLLAFRHAPDFEVNILNYLWPILIVVFSAVFNQTKLTLYAVLGVIFGFIGALLLFVPEQNMNQFAALQRGHILAIIGAALWALYSVFTVRHKYPAGFLAPIMLICGVFYLGMHLVFEETVMPSALMLGVIVIFGISRFCYALWDYAMQKGDQVLISAAAYFTPLLSTILFIFFGLKPASPYVAIAGVFIICGCLIVNTPKIVSSYERLKEGDE